MATIVLGLMAGLGSGATSGEVPVLKVKAVPRIDDGLTHRGVVSGTCGLDGAEGIGGSRGDLIEYHLPYAFWVMMDEPIEDYSFLWTWRMPALHDLWLGSVTDPTGAASGSFRVRRGGSWLLTAGSCRSARRLRYEPGNRNFNLGFRLALSPAP